MKEFEPYIQFQESLFGSHPVFQKVDNIEIPIVVDTIVQLVKKRPLKINEIAQLACKYGENEDFRKRIIKKTLKKCPVLTSEMIRLCPHWISFINHRLNKIQKFFPCLYFFENIPDLISNWNQFDQYEKFISYYNDGSIFLWKKNGFLQDSIEYCIKYDDLLGLNRICSNAGFSLNGKVVWSPFEWSEKPKSLSFLSVTAFYGSLQCFKQFLVLGCSIDQTSAVSSFCGANHDIIHICFPFIFSFADVLEVSLEFFHWEEYQYLYNQHPSIHHMINNKFFISIVHAMDNNFKTMSFNETNPPTHDASKKGSVSLLKGYADHCISLSEHDSLLMTPLHYAVKHCHLDVCSFLVKFGVPINAKNGLEFKLLLD